MYYTYKRVDITNVYSLKRIIKQTLKHQQPCFKNRILVFLKPLYAPGVNEG